MSTKTGIQWTDATWNPIHGCSKVSPGCAHCYAETLSLRYGFTKLPWLPENAAENVRLRPDKLEEPLHWRKPRRVFVNSMSDLFHEQVPDSFIDQVFAVMAQARQHTFQVLTKRPDRMLSYMRGELTATGHRPRIVKVAEYLNIAPAELRGSWPLPNVWLGVSVENQHWADVRIPLLLDTPAAVRFLSCEPLLGPVDLDQAARRADGTRRPNWGLDIHWVIVGGESGPNYRPFNPTWARQLQEQCRAAGVAYFFKQHGGLTPKSGGDLLDGAQYHEFPAVPA